MENLLSISHELLQLILAELEAEDLARLRLSCSSLCHFVENNNLLWKHIYLRNFNEPRLELGSPEPAWEDELKSVIRARKVLESSDSELKRTRFTETADVVLQLIRNVPEGVESSSNLDVLAELFESQDNVNAFLCGSSLFGNAGTTGQTPYPTEGERQMSARLHCYYGLPDDSGTSCSMSASPVEGDDPEPDRSARQLQTHAYARAQVYDLRNYTERTMWGPFRDDDSYRVDWEKVEAVMVVLGFNLKIFRRGGRSRHFLNPQWDAPFVGASPKSFVARFEMPPVPIRPVKELPVIDEPYGITGTWMRIVCFLDYTDLYSFNFVNRIPAGQAREPLETEEATRLIMLELRATAVEAPDERDGQELPAVSFTGTSRSIHAFRDPNANSKIRGTVRLTPEGEIRWTTFSIFHGNEERWRSEGIQVGGLRSARGIFGNWFDKDYDPHGPAGPTAFWKLSSELSGITSNIDAF